MILIVKFNYWKWHCSVIPLFQHECQERGYYRNIIMRTKLLCLGHIMYGTLYESPTEKFTICSTCLSLDESPMAEESPGSRCQPPVPISGTGFGHHLSKSGIRENGLLGGDYRNKSAVRGEDDLITWMPIAAINDIVDLSDEDTIKKKKKVGYISWCEKYFIQRYFPHLLLL